MKILTDKSIKLSSIRQFAYNYNNKMWVHWFLKLFVTEFEFICRNQKCISIPELESQPSPSLSTGSCNRFNDFYFQTNTLCFAWIFISWNSKYNRFRTDSILAVVIRNFTQNGTAKNFHIEFSYTIFF